MNVVDSSGWLEYFRDGRNVGFFAPAVEDLTQLAVPSISIHEVFKRVLELAGESEALQAAALMQQGRVVDLDTTLAVSAAVLSHELGLPLADAVVLATARRLAATVWTQDSDFQCIKLLPKKLGSET